MAVLADAPPAQPGRRCTDGGTHAMSWLDELRWNWDRIAVILIAVLRCCSAG